MNASAATARSKIPTTSSPSRSEASNEVLDKNPASSDARYNDATPVYFRVVRVRTRRERIFLWMLEFRSRRAHHRHRQRKRIAESCRGKRAPREPAQMAHHHVEHPSAKLHNVHARRKRHRPQIRPIQHKTRLSARLANRTRHLDASRRPALLR